MNNSSHFLNRFHPDEEFLDETTLIGHVYTTALKLSTMTSKSQRHHTVLHLIADVFDSMIPACTTCGKPMQQLTCEACRSRARGVLNINL